MRALFLFFVLISAVAVAQTTYSFDDSLRTERIMYDISVLAHDSLMGREGGSEYEMRAGNYVISEYTKCGLIPVPGADGFRQEFVLRNTTNEKGDSVTVKSNNIIGYIENNAPYTVVIGAHYDHIGFYYKDSALYVNNGADDNASGAVGVMEMARYLSSGNLTKYNYILACWGSEEQGLVGSNYFCSSNVYPFEKIAFYVNFDMIGRLGWKTDQLDVFGLGTTQLWDSVVPETEYQGYKLKKFAGAVDASDHTCFYKNKTPYIYFTSGLPPVYHTPKDETPLINPKGVEIIISYAEEIIGRFDGSKPAFRTVSQKEMNKVYWYFLSQFMN
ncbi:Peptidase family M28 [anaerobic digester metagenome]